MALGTIQTGTGLASGIDIQGTVDKLMALAARPRDMLQTNTDAITTRQTTLTTLAALLYAIKVPTVNLAKAVLYQERTAASSAPNALAVAVTGNPTVGTYEYTPLRLAQRRNCSVPASHRTPPRSASDLSPFVSATALTAARRLALPTADKVSSAESSASSTALANRPISISPPPNPSPTSSMPSTIMGVSTSRPPP